MALDRIKRAASRLLGAAGFPAMSNSLRVVDSAPMGDPVDLGPGISGSLGNYYGGYFDYGAGGDGSKWQFGLSSSGATPVLDHTMLRQNARSAYHDSMPARAVVERFADTVPGIGLRLEPEPKAAVLGMTPEESEKWSLQVAEAFDAFMSSKKFSKSEDETGYQSQRFATIAQQRDGEYFVRLHYSADKNLTNPLQISFIDPVQIQGYPLTDTYGLPYADCGIDYDKYGKELRYRVLAYDYSSKKYTVVSVPRVGRRSGRLLMLHGFQKEYPGQKRGFSRLSHAIQEFENFTDFELSHIKKAINDAAVAMWVEPSDDNPASNPFMDAVSGPAGNFQAPQEPDVVTDTSATTGVVNYSAMNEVALTPNSVGVFNLEPGEKLHSFQPSTPADNYDRFVNAFMKSLSASMSMPAEILWMQFGENYSASRATLVLFWQVVEIWRNELISDYLAPIYEMWLSGEIAAGRIQAPGWSDPNLRCAWLNADWVGFPLPNIDPSKTASADEKYVNLGATTLDRVARQYNGSSGRANRAKLKREFTELPESPFPGGKQSESENESEGPSNRPPGRPPGS